MKEYPQVTASWMTRGGNLDAGTEGRMEGRKLSRRGTEGKRRKMALVGMGTVKNVRSFSHL